MYHFCFVLFVTLTNVAAAFGSNCTSYYVLVEKHYDRDIETTTLDMRTEQNRYANKLRIYNKEINWKTSKINTDDPDLERFDHNCVIDLVCRDVKRDCLKKIKPEIVTGTDYRISDKENTTVSNISTDHGKKDEMLKKANSTPDDNLGLTNTNKTNTTISTDHGIEDDTLKKTNLSEPDHKIVNLAPDDNLGLTTVTDTNKTNTTISTDHGVEDDTLKKTNLSEPDHKIKDLALDDNLGLTTVRNTNKTNTNISTDHGNKDEIFPNSTLSSTNEIANAKETTNLNNNVIDLESKPQNAKVDPVENKNTSTEETTDINKEVILLKNKTALHNSNNTRLNKSENYSSPTNKQTSGALQAGKIAAGIMGAGALVAVVLVAKKMIAGCLQSGVYNIPA